MLTTLKAKMRNDVEFGTSLEAASEYISENNDDIKDVFLDDFDALVIGAENDPEIAKLVDSLPDDPDVEVVTASDIEKIEDLVEGFIPESVLTEGSVTESIEDGYEDGDVGDADEDEEEEENEVFEELEDIELDDLMEADFDNILATKQDEVEDAPDKDPVKSEPFEKNIDGEKQDDIEDAPDATPAKSTPNTENIKGEKQDTIEDVGESFEDFDDLDLDID